MKKIIFLYLKAFSGVGGIEKFNKAFMKALTDLAAENKMQFKVVSPYDVMPDERYVSLQNFQGFNKNKISFVYHLIINAYNCDTLIVGHINLSIVALLMKVFNPSLKIILITHGIEVWYTLPSIKRKLLRNCDLVLAVSNFTKNKIIERHGIEDEKIQILHNTIDPYLVVPDKFEKPKYLLERYQVNENVKIILTVTRITKQDQYKGYDLVLECLPELMNADENFLYLLVGKIDFEEKVRLNKKIADLKISEKVRLIGYVEESELIDHYQLADIFILPSKKEGFGIVFIEALTYGLSVIAGNQDGSVDALKNGELGSLIDPGNISEIRKTILKYINEKQLKNKYSENAIRTYAFKFFRKNISDFIS